MHRKEPRFRKVIDWYRGEYRDGSYDGDGEWEAERFGPPVQTVDIEDFGDPHESCDVVEAIVDEEEEPEVYFDAGFAVTWCLVS
jgi:hypothetical protein